MPDASTVAVALAAGADRLSRAAIGNARQEARWILAALTGDSLGELWLRQREPMELGLEARYRRAVATRAAGVPRAYATGRQAFRRLDLGVDQRALIPRPETEGLVDLVLAWAEARWGDRLPWGSVVDVGTGTGCLALSLATEGRFRWIIALDRSRSALELARANRARVRPRSPVWLLHADLLEAFAVGADPDVDIVVSNPPYLTEREYAQADRAVVDHEPREALVGGPTGIEVTARLLAQAAEVLRPGGLAALEIDARRGDSVIALAHGLPFRRTEVLHDLAGLPRYLLCEREE